MSSPISKSAFIKAEQCLKHFYLYKNHYYLRDSLSKEKQLIFKRGTDVGIFAQQLFAGGIDVTAGEKRDQQLFAEKTKQAQLDAKNKIDFILKKSIFWEHHQATELNERQVKVIGKFFDFGEHGLIKTGINSERYQNTTGCSSATATRDLKDMVNKGILETSAAGGRSLRYFIKLIESKPVFAVFPKANHKKLLDMSLKKIADDMQRNIEFFQGPNPQLDTLVLKYQEFAEGDAMHLKKLDQLLSQLDKA